MSKTIPKNDKDLLAAQAKAGMAGVDAYEAARSQLQTSQQSAVAGALASAESRGGPEGAMESAMGETNQIYAQRDSNLVASQAAYEDAQASRTQRNDDYSRMVGDARGLIENQTDMSVAPINAQSEANISAIRRQSEADTVSFQHQMEMQRLKMEAEQRQRDAAAARSSGGGGGGGGGSSQRQQLNKTDFLKMATTGAAEDLNQAQRIVQQTDSANQQLGVVGGFAEDQIRSQFKENEGKGLWDTYQKLENEARAMEDQNNPRFGGIAPIDSEYDNYKKNLDDKKAEIETAMDRFKASQSDHVKQQTGYLAAQAGGQGIREYFGAEYGTQGQEQIAAQIASMADPGQTNPMGLMPQGPGALSGMRFDNQSNQWLQNGQRYVPEFGNDQTFGFALNEDGSASGTAAEAMRQALGNQANEFYNQGYDIDQSKMAYGLDELQGRSIGDLLSERQTGSTLRGLFDQSKAEDKAIADQTWTDDSQNNTRDDWEREADERAAAEALAKEAEEASEYTTAVEDLIRGLPGGDMDVNQLPDNLSEGVIVDAIVLLEDLEIEEPGIWENTVNEVRNGMRKYDKDSGEWSGLPMTEEEMFRVMTNEYRMSNTLAQLVMTQAGY